MIVLQRGAAAVPPCIQLRFVSVYRAAFLVRMAMNWQALILLP
jgi:hypothetical protein